MVVLGKEMRVKVRIWGTLRKPAKPENVMEEIPSGMTLKEFLNSLHNLIDLNDVFFVIVNGVRIDRADSSKIKLMDGDTIAVVPVAGGG